MQTSRKRASRYEYKHNRWDESRNYGWFYIEDNETNKSNYEYHKSSVESFYNNHSVISDIELKENTKVIQNNFSTNNNIIPNHDIVDVYNKGEV